MKKSRLTEEQIVAALKEHRAGAGTKDLCRRLGIAAETLYNWKRRYGGLEVSEARRLRALEGGEALAQLARVDEALSKRISEHRRIIAFRNILIHGYADVDGRLVWDVVETKLPRLKREVEALLAET